MQNIQSIISTTVKSLYDVEFTPDISPAPKAELGEYCIGVFQLAKPVGKAPNMIAEEVARELAKHTDIFISTNSISGYVNFFLADAVWINLFSSMNGGKGNHRESEGDKLSESDESKKQMSEATELLSSSGAFGTFGSGKVQKTIVVDYIGANIGKPLHIGHLCTPSIGQSIINVYRHLGYTVIGDTHVGDWGLFGKLIAAHKLFGRENGLEEKGVEYLLELYIEITARCEQDTDIEEYCRNEFKKLSEGDQENMNLWGRFTSVSLQSMNKILETIHVIPDYDIGESFYENLPLPKIGNQPPLQYDMNSIIEELLSKNIATRNEDGSVAVIFPEETKLPSVVIQKKNGTNLYLTADICAIKYRLTNGWNPMKIIYSVDLRQQLHFKQCFEICRMAGWLDNIELFHAGNGHISLPDGAMSTRKGNIIRLEDLVNEAFERTKKILEGKGRIGAQALSENNIQEIAVGALKYSYLMQDRERNVVFDWDKALSFEGNSGPYIQYACVRAKKISEADGFCHPEGNEGSRKGQEQLDSSQAQNDETRKQVSTSLKLSEHDKNLIRTLAHFADTVNKTAETYKPHHLALYAYELAVTFNGFYVHTPKILEEKDEDLKNFRLGLVVKTSETLETAFDLLGIKMPSEM